MDKQFMKKLDTKKIEEKTSFIRQNIIDICVKNKAGHIAPSFSTVEILCSLYYSIMSISENPEWDDRDRLVFSKAHGCYALYAILADIGYVKKEEWENFYISSALSGCVERNLYFGIEASCGSLGHGLPIAVGIAFGAKLLKKKYKVYCVVGDGEMQEGSNWEAVQFAVKHKLDNLFLIIDNNGLQAMDFIENVLTVENRKDDLLIKLKAFGFDVDMCNGHDIGSILDKIVFLLDNKSALPKALIANTVKGYGLKCMENIPKFHFRLPTKEELKLGNRYE